MGCYQTLGRLAENDRSMSTRFLYGLYDDNRGTAELDNQWSVNLVTGCLIWGAVDCHEQWV
jgi:hypothetical protein